MSVTYRGVTLPEAQTADGSPILASKDWGYFGANGAHFMGGGTRGRAFSVSGTALKTVVTTMEGWLDGASGVAVVNALTRNNVVVRNVIPGFWFTDASDGLQYQLYTVNFLELLP